MDVEEKESKSKALKGRCFQPRRKSLEEIVALAAALGKNSHHYIQPTCQDIQLLAPQRQHFPIHHHVGRRV